MRALRMGLWNGKKVRLLAALLLLPLAGCTMFRAFERSQVYHPHGEVFARVSDFDRPVEDFFLTSKDGGRLHAWYFPPATDSRRSDKVVLFCHGNGGNLTSRPGYYKSILETGVALLTFDYRGYGRSEGSVSEEGTYLDAEGAYAWVRQKGFAATNIILWGESLGGAVATELALRQPAGGLVLHASFTSVPDIGAEFFPWMPVRLLATIHYNTLGKLPRVTCPVLVMHSKDDRTIAYHHGERNFAAAKEPKLFWELRGDHNDALEADQPRYVAGMEKFLQLIEEKGK
jgi:fermentation-respiration switch protein FrsA (DUF1100 family)